MPTHHYLGIDLGTTFLKGAVLDVGAGTISQLRRVPVPPPVGGLPATRYGLDPNALIAAVHGLLDGLLASAPDAAGLVLCSQMHCLVLTDERGRPRSNIITWKDQRAPKSSPDGRGTLFEELAERVGPEDARRLGGEMRVGVPIATLFALRRQGLLPYGDFAASLPDFVMANLCGVEPTTDPTLASAQGLFDIDRADWHRDLIAKLGFDGLRWPRIQPSGSVVGTAHIDGRTLACHAPIGDQQCALLGADLQEGELSLNISTGSQASLLSRAVPRGDFQVRPYLDGLWLKTIVSVPAGRSLGLLVELLTEIGRCGGRADPDPWAYIRDAVDRVESTDLEVDLSFFASLTGARGRIGNIHEGNLTVGHLFAAAFRSMATNYARCATLLSPERDWSRVVFSGGLAQGFPRLRRDILAALGAPPHRVCTTEEDTLAGLLVLARNNVCEP